ncbi:uncharacterized protein LOC119729013 isoform X2 [Patiria miniata]|uniref:BTB domain-containing protein n=1 Tax=Patiria miniata TaxID=46514 RepID=A0A914A1C4_PATMI|nr:uncharacterized protein LOC119729013 isoform X2 [Patiria miniata]
MNEGSQIQHDSDDCMASQSDHEKLLERINSRKLYNARRDEKSGAQKLVEQTSLPDTVRAGESDTSKTSSRRGKLSLRRDANRPGHSGKQNSSATSQTKAPKEVMKAILGETTLNQSSDFKEPRGCRAPLHEPKGRRRLGSSLSRAKSSKARNNPISASVHASTSTGKTQELTAADAGRQTVSRVKLNTPELSDDSNTKSSLDTTGSLNSTRTSPVKACSVYVSKLKLSTDSLSHTKLNDKVATSEVTLEPVQLPNSANDDPTKYSNTESELGSLTETSNEDQAGDTAQKCPVCHEAFLGDDATENLQQHVQMCLRQRFASSIQSRDFTANSDDTSGDEEFARLLQRREEEKVREERLTDSEKYFCQICQRELSHMNSTRRSQHINRCMDSMETVEPQQEPAASGHQTVRGTVPDCPICGKHFKTKKQRESHLKKCARVNQVSAQRLIELVKVQEEVQAQGEGLGGSIGGSTGGSKGGSMEGATVGSLRGAKAGSLEGSVGGFTGGATGASLGASVGGFTGGSVEGSVGSSAGGSTGGSVGGSLGGPAAVGDTLGSTHAPESSRPTVRRGRGGRNATRGRSRARGKGRRKPQVPVEAQPLDEETQVAMALSASLVQQPDPGPSTEGTVAQPASTTGRAPKPPGKTGRKKKAGRKEGNKEVPLLIKRTEEERSRLLEARMADIILPQEVATVQKTPSLKKSKVARRHRQPSPWKPRTCIHLAEAAAAVTHREQRDEDQKESSEGQVLKKSQTLPLWSLASDCTSSSQTPFYVHRLLPVVTPQKRVTSRRANAVGGPTTPGKHSQEQFNQQTSPFKGTPHTTAPSSRNVSLTPSQEGSATQALGRTVQILADLAAESALPACATQSSDRSLITASGFIPADEEEAEAGGEEPKHLNEEDNEESMIAVNQHQMEILQSLAGLVNSKDLSDLHLVTSDGSVIYAHQFMIKLRCPSLYKLIEESPSYSSSQAKSLDLRDFSHGSLLCALHFIYSGRGTVTSSTADEVWKFAKRFSLPKLSDICSEFHNEIDKSRAASERDVQSSESDLVSGPQGSTQVVGQENEDFFANRGLDDLIQSLWDSSDEETDDHHKEDGDDASDDSDGNQKAPASQTKRRFSHRVSDTDSDTEAKDIVPDDKELDEIYEFFSTQRQQRSQRSNVKKSEDSGDAESDENAVDEEEVDNDGGEVDEENSEKVSANCRRQSFTIVEQLQSSCLPQSQRSQTNEVSSELGDVNSKHLRDHVLQEQTAKRQKFDGSSNGVAEHINSSSELITPCFVHVKRLSNDLSVSPLKEKHTTATVGKCLELQCNLKTGHMESRQPELNELKENTKKLSQIPGEHCSIHQGADATLADVGDSIFQYCDENEDDVEMLDVSQTSESEIDQPSTVQSRKIDMEGDQNAFNQSADLLGSFSSERGKDVSDMDEVESTVKVPTDRRGTCSSSGSEDESLPNVNMSQPEKQVSERPEDSRSSGHPSEEEMVSDEGPELSVSEDAKEQSRDSGEDAVIDLSQDDEDQEIESVESGLEEGNCTDNNKDTVQEDFSDKDRDEDLPIIVPLSPDPTLSGTKITSNPPKTYLPTKKPSPSKPPILKPLKFTFRRRDRQGDTKEIPVRTEPTELNTFGTPAVYRMERTKPKSSDAFATILETPAAFRAEADVIRDSSTPMFGTSAGGVSNRHDCISPKISPVKESTNDDQGKGKRVGALTRKETSRSSDSSNKSGRGIMNDGSPVLKLLSKNSLSKKDKDIRATSTTNSLSKATVFEATQEDSSVQEESGPDSPSLSGTPVRPTPDCFDADTPVIVSSIPPAPLSPSPPPSPTFGSVCSLKAKESVSDSSEHQHLDDSIVDERSAREESFSTRCKRKLQQEDLEWENVEAPSKRPKGLAIASHGPPHTVINTNLSPACTTDEDDVVLVSNEEENGEVLRSSRSGSNGTNTGIAVRSDKVSWPEQLCVGLSPTRYSPESPSSDEAEISQDAFHDASTPRIQVDKASVLETTGSLKEYSLPVSPAKDSKCQSSPGNSPEPKSWSQNPFRRRDTENAASRSNPQSFTLSQKSASDVESTPSTLAQNASEDQFAYFGDDGGGYMDDFSFCSDGERGPEGVEVEVIASEKTHTKTNTLKGGGAVSHLEKPSTSDPNPLKSASGTRRGFQVNLSIQNFSSSEEDASPPKLALRLKDYVGVLSTSMQLREEAEEFGCSESFLFELKAGHVDEETAWGGVMRTGGGLDVEQAQSKKKF